MDVKGEGAWRWAPPVALAAAAGLAALKYLPLRRLLPPCPFRLLTGLPCLSCGGTHSALALAAGNIGQAVIYNPLVALGAILLAAAGALGIAERLLGRPLLSPDRLLRRPRLLRLGIGLLLLANWLYLGMTLKR